MENKKLNYKNMETEKTTQETTIVSKEHKMTTYLSNSKEVSLNHQIVRNYLTKGNGNVTDQDIVQFIGICKYNSLNPFLNEAYLVKFGTTPAQMITAKEAYFKRAESHSQYDGVQAGIIVQRGNDIIEVEGAFMFPKDILLGGWAKVYRKDRQFPCVAKVNLHEYDKKQSVWNDKKSTMISKCAKVAALREAFPSELNALYTAEEQGYSEGTYTEYSENRTSLADAAANVIKRKKEQANQVEEVELVEIIEEQDKEIDLISDEDAVEIEQQTQKENLFG